MKKMMKRLITLTAALALVLSMTAMVCSAEYESDDHDDYVAPCSDAEINNSVRN